MLAGATRLLRRQGYAATGWRAVVAECDAPWGSQAHHFPGGKEQLGGEVIRASGAMYYELFELIMDASPDVVTGVESFFAGAAETLRRTDYADACPIATVALEVASTSEPLRQATADVFESWIEGATARFAAAGVEQERARRLAISVLCQLEGGFLFCRAAKSTEALEAAGAAAVAEVRDAVGV